MYLHLVVLLHKTLRSFNAQSVTVRFLLVYGTFVGRFIQFEFSMSVIAGSGKVLSFLGIKKTEQFAPQILWCLKNLDCHWKTTDLYTYLIAILIVNWIQIIELPVDSLISTVIRLNRE